MSLFKGIVNMFTEGKPTDDRWRLLQSKSQVDELIKNSADKPQLFYKHSSRCGICSFTKSELESSEELAEKAEMNFVDVIAAREVSDRIAEQLNIRHESPQAILVKDGKVIWSGSHAAIKSAEILNELDA